MELLTITLAAGETKRFERAGTHFEIIDSAGAIDVQLNAADGLQGARMLGAVAGLYSDVPYTALDITNRLTVAQIITIMIASNLGGSRRAPGVVQVVDSARQLVVDGKKFGCTLSISTPAAAQFAIGQLWNGTSNLGIALRTVAVLSSDLAGSVIVAGTLTAQAGGNTVIATVPSKRLPPSGQQLMPTGVERRFRWDNASGGAAGIIGGFVGVQGNLTVPTGTVTSKLILDDGPIVIGPGVGLSLSHSTAQSGMVVYFEGETFAWAG